MGSKTLRNSGAGEPTAPRTPQLYLVVRAPHPLRPPARIGLDGIDEVVIGRGADEIVRAGRSLTVRVDDRWMSSVHGHLRRKAGRWMIEDAGSTNGTVVNGATVTHAALADHDVLELGRTFFVHRSAVEPGDPAGDGDADGGLTTLVPSLARAYAELARVAASGVPVLLGGETGTGKEVVARALHARSGRPGPMVAVNCAALPQTLVETELFGYRRGAFSGAGEDRPGLVRTADRGTLFLDEIGDLAAPSQAALLRVLQEREVVPVGDTRPRAVDVRVIAATHHDLDELVEAGRFRQDLRMRLGGYQLELPPLRERVEDVGLILRALLPRIAPGRADAISFHPAAVRALLRHAWPGNVRELQAALAAAVALAVDGEVRLEHLPVAVRRPSVPPPDDELTRQRRDELDALFREHKGNIHAVARAMGKARVQIQRWVKRYQLDLQRYRTPR